MIIPDVNLLLYAEISAFPQHAAAHRWWRSALEGDRLLGLAPVCLFGFVRIATHRRVFEPPMTVVEATRRVRRWLEQPNATLLVPGPRHLEIALGLLEATGAAGNLTTDAQLAAFALEANGEVFSNDADFGRFEGLRWSNPLR